MILEKKNINMSHFLLHAGLTRKTMPKIAPFLDAQRIA